MTELYTLSQKRILSAIKYEFIKMNDKAVGYMEPLSDEAYTALIKEWNKLPEYE